MELYLSNEQTAVPVTPNHAEIVRQVLERTLSLAESKVGSNVSVSVTLCDDAAVQELNREYRAIDRPTDVLSFAMLEGEELAALPQDEPLPLGDIVVSMERCREQAQEYDHSFERELGFLVAHGMLHLLGYDHQNPTDEARMMATTEQILSELGLTRE